MGRRAHGEGTITQRSDGTWMGQISLGYDGEGKRKRKTVYGKTQKEVRAKLDEIKQQLASGTFSDTKSPFQNPNFSTKRQQMRAQPRSRKA